MVFFCFFKWHLIQFRATNFIFNSIIKLFKKTFSTDKQKHTRPFRTRTHALCVLNCTFAGSGLWITIIYVDLCVIKAATTSKHSGKNWDMTSLLSVRSFVCLLVGCWRTWNLLFHLNLLHISNKINKEYFFSIVIVRVTFVVVQKNENMYIPNA